MAKPRVVISTDIGGSDPDDFQSMVHALLYADKIQIEALISTPTKHGGRASHIHEVIDKYALDYNNLKTWSSEYPTPASLKSVVYQGNLSVAPSAGYSTATAGSKAIIAQAKEAAAAGEKLWVLTWGALTDVAQALHDDPSIQSALRLYSIGAWNDQQDPFARDYIYNNFKNLWWIESDSTFRGMYVNDSGVESNSWRMSDAQGHGALGDYFYAKRPWGLKMGDTPSLLYLLDTANNETPGASSWGGAYKQTGHGPAYWTDNPDPALRDGTYNGSETVRIHQPEFYKDFALRFDRAKSPNPNAGNADDPVFANNDVASTLVDKAVVIKVLANDSAPDGGLAVASVDATSAQGGKIVKNADGTLTYTPKLGFVGDDTFKYVARDTDGDTATATVSVKVANSTTTPPPSGGTGNPVVAVDDPYKIDSGKSLYVNSRYLTWNDKGLDGGLQVIDVAKTSASGIAVSWAADGTIVYKSAAGWNGIDTVNYTLSDVDGSTDIGAMVITVGTGVSMEPTPTPEPTPPPTSGGTGNPVVAVDDPYKIDSGKSLWVNSRYLTWNDKGLDGGLKVIDVAKTSAAGVAVSWAADGTIVYKSAAGWNGIDTVNYTVSDVDGSTDIGAMVITVGTGGATTPPPTSDTGTSTGTGNPVAAVDDSYKIDVGKTFWMNARYFTWNDKGLDGGLKVIAVDAKSAAGHAVSFASDGTVKYDPSDFYKGTDRFDYKVSDVDGSTDIGTVFIQVGNLLA